MKKFLQIGIFILTISIIGAFFLTTFAGSLTPSVSPSSTMYTLDDVYNKITNNSSSATEGAQSFTTPGSVSTTFHTLKQIYESIPILDVRHIHFGTHYMGVTGTLFPAAGLPKTNQTFCWNPADPTVTIPCAGTGQDGQYQAGVSPAIGTRFTDNNDGTIEDEATTLMWKKCSEGLSGASCGTGSATTMDWATALSTCEADTTAGYTNWRLPNRLELVSLVDFKATSLGVPVIDTTYFPNTQTADDYFSSSSFQTSGATDNAWTVNFGSGFLEGQGKTSIVYVRCVR